MTDFIHEKPKDPNAAPPPAEEAPISQKGRQKRVFTYGAILFGVAFVLILWSFLMTHRSNQLMISELKDRTSALQSMVEQNDALRADVERLEDELTRSGEAYAVLSGEKDALQAQLDDAGRQLRALDALRELQSLYDQKQFDDARAMIDTIRTADDGGDLSVWLPDEAGAPFGGEERLSPAAVYQQLVDELYPPEPAEN